MKSCKNCVYPEYGDPAPPRTLEVVFALACVASLLWLIWSAQP